MAEPFRGEIYQKGNGNFDLTYETDPYLSVSDAMQDVVYQIEESNISIAEEETTVIIREISDEEAYS